MSRDIIGAVGIYTASERFLFVKYNIESAVLLVCRGHDRMNLRICSPLRRSPTSTKNTTAPQQDAQATMNRGK
jgi:hypothetical protein